MVNNFSLLAIFVNIIFLNHINQEKQFVLMTLYEKKYAIKVLLNNTVFSNHVIDKIIYSDHNFGIIMSFSLIIWKNNFFFFVELCS